MSSKTVYNIHLFKNTEAILEAEIFLSGNASSQRVKGSIIASICLRGLDFNELYDKNR